MYKKCTFSKFTKKITDSETKNKSSKLYNDSILSSHDRIEQLALDASDNGRCWWIYEFIKGNPLLSIKK